MTARHYNEAFSAEWEAVQRWETEGGKLRQQHDNIFGSIGEGYQRDLDQAVRKNGMPTSSLWAHTGDAVSSVCC